MSYLDSSLRLGRRAIVIGGSMAGLVTARVLHQHFDQVIVIDRDVLPDRAEYLRTTLFRAVFPDLWAIRDRL